LKRTTTVGVALVAIVVVISSIYTYSIFGSGTLEVRITDPPSWGQATQVYINYSSIEIHRADAGNDSGWFTIVDQSAWINLTSVLDVNKTIGYKSLQAGVYNLIRFSILDAIVTVGGQNHTATVPSGKLQIAITTGGIRITTGQTATLLIDLNTKVEDSFNIVPDVRATPA